VINGAVRVLRIFTSHRDDIDDFFGSKLSRRATPRCITEDIFNRASKIAAACVITNGLAIEGSNRKYDAGSSNGISCILRRGRTSAEEFADDVASCFRVGRLARGGTCAMGKWGRK